LLVLTAQLTTYCQPPKSNWKRLLPDTSRIYYVIGPEAEFYLMAGNRKVADEIGLRKSAQIALLMTTNQKCDEKVSILLQQKETVEDEAKTYREAYRGCSEELMNANLKVAKLKPWATVGKVGTILVSVVIVGTITVYIIETATP
jgi:hypothetical protein